MLSNEVCYLNFINITASKYLSPEMKNILFPFFNIISAIPRRRKVTLMDMINKTKLFGMHKIYRYNSRYWPGTILWLFLLESKIKSQITLLRKWNFELNVQIKRGLVKT